MAGEGTRNSDQLRHAPVINLNPAIPNRNPVRMPNTAALSPKTNPYDNFKFRTFLTTVASVISGMIVHPIDTIKIRMQV